MPGRKGGQRPRKRMEPFGRKAMWFLSAVAAACLVVLLFSVMQYDDSVREIRRHEEERFDRYNEHLLAAIESLEEVVAPESAAGLDLAGARNARRAAMVQEGTNLREAQERLEEGYQYLCAAMAASLQHTCEPPHDDWKVSVIKDPEVLAVTKGVGAIGLTGSGVFAAIQGTLWGLSRRRQPEGVQ